MVVANCDGEGASMVSRAQQVVRMKKGSKVAWSTPHSHIHECTDAAGSTFQTV